jgi:Flp pilus assembly protein TadG
MAKSGWTALALLLLAWCIIGLIAWGISFHKRELARENLEDSKRTTTHIVLNSAAATASANGARPATTVTTKQTNAQGHVVYVTTTANANKTLHGKTDSTKGVSTSGSNASKVSGTSGDGFDDKVTVVKK